ncbi:MAG TPA: class I SAM-dependent methyltransferase [Bradyrhizobium sp.]|nr:class I SAM-dependent methyltransferase [Bradyrhizobium sp.]
MDLAPGGAELQGIYSDIEAYYGARVAKYGATPLGVDWSCEATQNLRFVQLLKVCDFSTPFSLNDVGCGYGALCAFLAMRYPDARIDYLGVDLSKAMISRARRRFRAPDRRFVVGQASPRLADYSVASGVMNVNVGYPHAVWEDFVAALLGELRRTSRRGFSVNFISDAATASGTHGASRAPRLYRTCPERWISYCEEALGCSVEPLGNYGMREFTLLVRCQRNSADPTFRD